MKKLILSTALLMTISVVAQDYQWHWAQRGGGTRQSPNESNLAHAYDSEQILDIAVDQDNNYYFLAFMTEQNTEFAGALVTVYNSPASPSGNTDIVLISTDCTGALRWTQTIGGGVQDHAYKIALDDDGGLYVGANIFNFSGPQPNNYLPPHFSPTDAMPVLGSNTGAPQEGYKSIALLKYNTSDGSLAWRIMPQGDVTFDLRYGTINHVVVDPAGVIHTLIGFREGTHLDGEINVPDSPEIIKYFVVEFSSDGDILNILPVPIVGSFYLENTIFTYDAILQRYYLSGIRNRGSNTALLNLSFNGVPFTQQSYILAFTNTGEEIWRKEDSTASVLRDNWIHSLKIDTDSNIYITGRYLTDTNNTPVNFGNYQFPMNIVGNRNYVMKLNPSGEVQWINIPNSYSETHGNPNLWTGVHNSYDIAFRGDEVAIATEVTDEDWGAVSIDRPTGHMSDAGLLRLNKYTGETIALHDIMGTAGFTDAMTAVAVDNDGNYVVGGYFHKDLFTLDNDNVPTVTKVGGQQNFTDFFIAKLAASECGTLATTDFGYNNIKVYPNPTSGIINMHSEEKFKGYSVVNLLGQVLLKGEVQTPQNQISLESLSAGTYILNLTTTDGRIISHKVVKQ